jgi:uncharacterized protein DUF6519
MLSLDISRDSFQRAKNYSSLRQQQGRLPLDSELNEGADILADELRRAIKDVICTSGTPDDGFRISFASEAIAAYDFSIRGGTYYIGGLRYDSLADHSFFDQPDWLQMEQDLTTPPVPPTSGPTRHDFVYLEGWTQQVAATEDSELFERALAGADGAGRQRRMTRVLVITGTADNCLDAMEAAFPAAKMNPDTCTIDIGAGLTVDFNDSDLDENLCAPQVQTGFLGAENETFRVQLTAPNRFIYGRDNASHLYRVTLAEDPDDAARTIVTFLTRPRDAHSQPLAGQAVELLRWNTLLPNGEKLAEPTGALANIATDYDPDNQTITIDHTLDSAWNAWFGGDGASAINPLDGGVDDAYFYLRVWTGGSGTAGSPDHLISNSDPITMTGTGLTVVFAGTGVANVFGQKGDYWVVAARPNAPDVVTPWRLLDESMETPPPAPPMGPMRHVAPLALIKWVDDGTGNYEPTVHDCRERFRKLCEVGTCCEVTVGDGEHSHGDVNSIAEALVRLPAAGGRVCLLRGNHEASVELDGLEDVTFSGCGAETVWTAMAGQPAVTLTACSRISFEHFEMQSDEEVVIAGPRDGETPLADKSESIHFKDMILYGRDRSALWLNDVDDIEILDSVVLMRELSTSRVDDDTAGQDPALFLLGEDVRVEGNTIGIDLRDDGTKPPVNTQPLGGIQIGGMSSHVSIRHNRIDSGKGNGITLGHLEWVEQIDSVTTGPWTLGGGFYVNEAGCLVPWYIAIPPETEDVVTLIPRSGGEIVDLKIRENLITDMGLNGIAVCHYFDLTTEPQFITISDTRIIENRITGCLTSDLTPPDLEQALFMGFGGIALGGCDLIRIEGNDIYDNAIAQTTATCGVFILHGAGIGVSRNRIHSNGATPEAEELPFGRRGGVIIGWSVTHAGARADESTFRATPARMPALVVSENFIDSSHGQALKVTALGPVQVRDNRLNGAGEPPVGWLALLGFLLQIHPLGSSLGLLLVSVLASSDVSREDFADGNVLFAELIIAILGGSAVSVFNLAFLEEFSDLFSKNPDISVGGETLFNDNQVSLMPHGAQQGTRVSSLLVASLDDVLVNANQLEVERGGGFVLTNAYTPAASVRMTSNRMQEHLGGSLFSGIAHGMFMATQSNNQGTMCFLAHSMFGFGTPNVEKHHNISVIDLFTGGQVDGGFCGGLARMLEEFMKGTAGDIAPNYQRGVYPMFFRINTTLDR